MDFKFEANLRMKRRRQPDPSRQSTEHTAYFKTEHNRSDLEYNF